MIYELEDKNFDLEVINREVKIKLTPENIKIIINKLNDLINDYNYEHYVF